MMQRAPNGLVLVVDDDPVNLQVISEALSSETFEVAFASDGETALEQIAQELPDVVILDALMPGMNGFAICEKLKTDPATRDIPVLFMTALADVKDRLRGFALGAADYLTKPFERQELLARIKTHLALRMTLRTLSEKNAALEVELEARRLAELERAELMQQIQEAHEARLAELSTPIIPITDTILVMPLIGIMDEARVARVLDAALLRASETSSQVLILDITGVPRADGTTAKMIINLARALGLLGTKTVLTGIRADVARALMELEMDFESVRTHSTLQAGVAYAMRLAREKR
jgi:CheY-like chemotaxis protein/anti-anti-sigma regulatory factor